MESKHISPPPASRVARRQLPAPAAASPAEPSPRSDEALTAKLRGQILAVLLDGNLRPDEKRTQICEHVLKALATRGQFYFHAERKDFDSAMYFDRSRKLLERIRADAFRSWLSEWTAINRADGLFAFVLAAVETAALSGKGTTGILPDAFWAARPGAIYLSNGDGAVVKITGKEIAEADNGVDGVLFPAGRTLKPWKLTEPRDPFETCSLFRDTRCSAQHGPDLLRIILCSLATNPRCKPPSCFAGDVGSGKTRLAKGIAELYGIPFIAAKVEDDREGDFWPNMDAGGLLTLDNADSKCKWLADALAAAATDGCSQRRRLYTNSETVTLRARAWVCVTSANPSFANDAGLADRLLVVRMDRRTGDTSDAALSDEIAQHRDAGLSHIAQTLRVALADNGPVPASLNARHPDFAAFAVRIGRALGREREFIGALTAAEEDKAAFCLENDFIGTAVVACVREAGEFCGTAKELLEKLRASDPDLADVSAKRVGKRLAALWPHLEKMFDARKELNRTGTTTFCLKIRHDAEASAGFAGFNSTIPINSPHTRTRGDFIENTVSNPANHAEANHSLPALPLPVGKKENGAHIAARSEFDDVASSFRTNPPKRKGQS